MLGTEPRHRSQTPAAQPNQRHCRQRVQSEMQGWVSSCVNTRASYVLQNLVVPEVSWGCLGVGWGDEQQVPALPSGPSSAASRTSVLVCSLSWKTFHGRFPLGGQSQRLKKFEKHLIKPNLFVFRWEQGKPRAGWCSAGAGQGASQRLITSPLLCTRRQPLKVRSAPELCQPQRPPSAAAWALCLGWPETT